MLCSDGGVKAQGGRELERLLHRRVRRVDVELLAVGSEPREGLVLAGEAVQVDLPVHLSAVLAPGDYVEKRGLACANGGGGGG